MTSPSKTVSRRQFMNCGLVTTACMALPGGLPPSAMAFNAPSKNNLMVIGPIEGYSPQIGTLVSMLNYNRNTIIQSVKSLTMQQLDFLFDPNANTIGGLLLHLAAVDKYYQVNSFEGRQELNEAEKKEWGAGLELGDAGRKEIKGHDVQHYLDKLTSVREKTLEALKNKDDKWLLELDPIWSKQEPINTYWKWFHVCEHESNHRGQIAWLKSRLPGAKPVKD